MKVTGVRPATMEDEKETHNLKSMWANPRVVTLNRTPKEAALLIKSSSESKRRYK